MNRQTVIDILRVLEEHANTKKTKAAKGLFSSFFDAAADVSIADAPEDSNFGLRKLRSKKAEQQLHLLLNGQQEQQA